MGNNGGNYQIHTSSGGVSGAGNMVNNTDAQPPPLSLSTEGYGYLHDLWVMFYKMLIFNNINFNIQESEDHFNKFMQLYGKYVLKTGSQPLPSRHQLTNKIQENEINLVRSRVFNVCPQLLCLVRIYLHNLTPIYS